MLRTLIGIRLQGIFMKAVKRGDKKNAGLFKVMLMIVLFLYIAVVFGGIFGYMFYSMLEPFTAIGYEWLYFGIMALTVIMLCFLGSIFMTQQEIYGSKDNDLLLSMPIKVRDILLSRIFVLLIMNYIYEAIVVLPCLFIYFIRTKFQFLSFLYAIIVVLTLPLLVITLSCIFGWVMAMIMRKIRNKTAITLILSLGFLGVYFYVINKFPEYVTMLVQNGKSIGDAIKQTLFPIYHLSIAITEGSFVSLIFYLPCVLIPFGIVLFLLANNFIHIAISKAPTKKVKLKENDMKYSSQRISLLKREFDHFLSKPTVILNAALGIAFTVVLAGAVLVKGADILELLGDMPKEAKDMFLQVKMPFLCFAVIATNSMNIMSASSISLEGNRLWILKSLPIKTKDILMGKVMFHLLLCIPPTILCSVVCSIVFSLGLLDSLCVILIPISFIIFEAFFGILMNLWKPKFDWVNETVVVKQSASVMITMFGTMALIALSAVAYIGLFDKFLSMTSYVYLCFLLLVIIDIVFYYMLNTWGTKRFNKL